jgi:peroxiredoxin
VLAVCVDPPASNAQVTLEEGLRFPLLSDEDGRVVRAYDLLHAGGAPGGADAAMPALLLLRPDGSVAWRHVSRRIQDRADPAAVMEAVRGL